MSHRFITTMAVVGRPVGGGGEEKREGRKEEGMMGKRGLRGGREGGRQWDRRELPSEEGEEYNSKQGFRTKDIYVFSSG